MDDWSAIVKQYGPMVWATAARLLGDSADAADCFQETFVAAVKARGAGAVDHWPALLARIATARSLDRLRRRLSESRRRDPAPDWSQLAAGDPDPSERAEARELAERTRRMLVRLPAREGVSDVGPTVEEVLNNTRGLCCTVFCQFAPKIGS